MSFIVPLETTPDTQAPARVEGTVQVDRPIMPLYAVMVGTDTS